MEKSASGTNFQGFADSEKFAPLVIFSAVWSYNHNMDGIIRDACIALPCSEVALVKYLM